MYQVYQEDQDQISGATYISDVVFFIKFFFIGLAVLGNRWHPHVVIRLIHCQFMDLHISYATLGLDFLRRIFFLHISWTRFQVSSRLEIFMAC